MRQNDHQFQTQAATETAATVRCCAAPSPAWICGIAAAGCCLIAGCSGSSGVPLAKVSGRVTFYGRPVAAEIIFQPLSGGGDMAGRPSTAISDKSGSYTLRYSPEERGAEIGRQRVTVKILPYADKGEPGSMKDATTPFKTARMERQVQRGSNRFDFAIVY